MCVAVVTAAALSIVLADHTKEGPLRKRYKNRSKQKEVTI